MVHLCRLQIVYTCLQLFISFFHHKNDKYSLKFDKEIDKLSEQINMFHLGVQDVVLRKKIKGEGFFNTRFYLPL